MFERAFIDRYEFERLPLDQDCYLMDECYLQQYESSLLEALAGRRSEPVGYVAFASVRTVGQHSIELSWFADIYSRFHEVAIVLHRKDFVTCLGAWRIDAKPRIFVRSGWLDDIYKRYYAVYCLIDAIGMKHALATGTVTREKLISLRDAVDDIAARHQGMAFVSFADNLLIKANWTVGHFQSGQVNTYEPEGMLDVLDRIRVLYRETLGLEVYAVLTQGANEYSQGDMLHLSLAGNHVCLNSLGISFSQLLSMQDAVSRAIHDDVHPGAELYLDDTLFRSLRLDARGRRPGFDRWPYQSRVKSTADAYVALNRTDLRDGGRGTK